MLGETCTKACLAQEQPGLLVTRINRSTLAHNCPLARVSFTPSYSGSPSWAGRSNSNPLRARYCCFTYATASTYCARVRSSYRETLKRTLSSARQAANTALLESEEACSARTAPRPAQGGRDGHAGPTIVCRLPVAQAPRRNGLSRAAAPSSDASPRGPAPGSALSSTGDPQAPQECAGPARPYRLRADPRAARSELAGWRAQRMYVRRHRASVVGGSAADRAPPHVRER